VIPGTESDDVVTVLHISDIHLNPLGFDLTDRLVRQFGVNVVVDTGDITSWGTEVESATLARIRAVGVPYVFVRGNHDSLRTQRAVAANRNAVVLDGGVAVVGGLVFAGLGDPRFTPDAEVTLPTPSSSSPAGAATAAGPGTSPRPSTAPAAVGKGEDSELVEGRRLEGIIRSWNEAHPDQPVAVAAFHEPAGTPPLDGVVPLVLSGHLHHRSVTDYPAGTRLMIEGSTGGAGFDSLSKAGGNEPVPLDATVLYFARTGPRAGQLLAYDDVTVGGFGLASVSLDRTVLRQGKDPALAPGEVRGTAAACPAPSGSPPRSPVQVSSGPASSGPGLLAEPGTSSTGTISPTACPSG
jgi:predicted MPP superfamily phosphohydrolase